MNTIALSFCEEDRRRIDELIGSVTLLASVIGNAQPAEVQKKIIEEVTAPLQQAEVSVGLPVEGAAHLEPVTVEDDPAPVPISLGEFQKALVTRCAESAAVKEKVQALVQKYAESVSAIPENKRAEVLAALAEI